MHKPLITALTTLLLAACAATPTPHAAQTTRPDSIITIPTTTATSNATLEQQYGGTIALRTDTFAIIANPTRQPLTAQSGEQYSVEKNKDGVKLGPTLDSGGEIWESFKDLWADAKDLWADAKDLWADTDSMWVNGRYAALPQNTDLWQKIGVDQAYATSDLGNGKVVAVIDSGVDLFHPMFSGIFTEESSHKDFVDNDLQPYDKGVNGEEGTGHGTTVLGIAVQISPKAKYMPIRVLDESGTGDIIHLAQAIVWAADHGANIINLSLGTKSESGTITQAIDYANSLGTIVVSAAGNTNKAVPDYPAAQFKKQGLNVAVASIDSNGIKSSFSSYGENISISALGEGITTAYPNRMTAKMSGTSASVPIVSATLSLGIEGLALNHQKSIHDLLSSSKEIYHINENSPYTNLLGAGSLSVEGYLREIQR